MKRSLPSNNKYDICDFLEYYTFIDGECDIEEYYYSSEEDDDYDSTQIDDIKSMLNRRLKLYYPYMPFRIHRNKIISMFSTDDLKNKNLHYLFCLYYSLYGGGKLSRKESTLFEIIVDVALKSYLNTQHSILTSFGDNELTIKEKIHELLNNTNELIGDLNLMPSHAKDGGIDIVTFKPLDDRGNQIIVLTDATLGKNWGEKKVLSKLKHWLQYIHFKTEPLTCLALARIVPTERFHYASCDNGLLFDRTRIVSFYVPKNEIEQELSIWRAEICVS